MPDSVPLNIPKPPDSPDLKEIHKHLLDLSVFLNTHFSSGTQSPFFSQNQLNQMSQLSQAGKVFMNHTTGKINVGEISGGNLVIKEVMTS